MTVTESAGDLTKGGNQVSMVAPALADTHPVQRALVDLGLGRLIADALPGRPGRNSNWVGTTTTGKRVFVKVISGGSSEDRVRRELAMHDLIRGQDGVCTTDVLGANRAGGVLVFAALDSGTTLASHLAKEKVTPWIFERLGRIVAALHALPVPRALSAGLREEEFKQPNRAYLSAIPLEDWAALSSGALDFYRLLQQDTALHGPLAVMCERTDDRAVVHGDLRTDQVVFTAGVESDPILIDFEEARIGDPARDLGALVGEIMQFVVATASTRDLGASGPDAAGERAVERVVAALLEGMGRSAPLLAALRRGYGQATSLRAGDFGERVMRAAGWHLFDRALARAQRGSALSTRDKAGAGIGRKLLCEPRPMAAALGWA